ncbi:MAG: ABC transporter ATP-binding protein [Candidatus Hodarchaeota archaeon]
MMRLNQVADASAISSTSSPLIQTRDLSRIYNANEPSEVRALDGVTLSIEEGEVIAITGPSGSGKSTLLHLIGGMDSPNKGDIWFKGQEIGKLPERKLADFRRKEIGFIFQSFYLIETLTVLENILAPLIPYGISASDRLYAKELLKIAKLDHRINAYPRQLSGGEKQRTAISRALINQPSVILADEPTGYLDTKTGNTIVSLLKSFNGSQGTTVLIVTHDLRIAAQANRILELQDGRLFQDR